MAAPEELVRVVARPGGLLAVGSTLPGRGAWICAGSTGCVDAAVRRKAFSRALRSDISADSVAAVRSSIEDRARMEGFASSRPAAG